ncbi:hypothetical protein Tco_1215321 [Tanacetum coccineum]
MGTVSDVITGGTEGAVQQGPDGKVVGSRCPWEDTMRYNQGRPFREKQWQDGNCVAWNARRQNRARECQGQSDFKIQYYFKDKMLLMQAQESGAVLDEEQCCFLQENRHVHDNISHRKDLIYDEAGTSYDSNTPSEGVQSRLTNKPDMVMNDSVTSKLARYKELVGEYEKRAKFELTDREQKIDEQMRIIISDRNRKDTSLKSELHSAQILLSSTVDHYKSKTEK